MPRRQTQRRCRTSSQSSVEMQVQVTKEDSVITTTTNISMSPCHNSQALQVQVTTEDTVSLKNTSPLVKPKDDFLELLRDVGAAGTKTPYGEIFTLKDLGQYLYKYLTKRELLNPWQPAVVRCDDDPLGRVFGVKMFTRAEADTLLLKSTSPVNFRKRRHPEVTSSDVEKADEDVPSQSAVDENDDISSTCLGDSSPRNPPKKPHMSSEGQPASDTESFTWFFQVPQIHTSDSEDEVYSVQGKVTDVVSDSSDDWSSYEELSIEIQSVQSSEQHYFEEYEVDSDSGSSIDNTQYDEYSGAEEIVVVCKESDMDGFWADSESSDSESSVSTDPELSDLDKWTCNKCENRNTPKRSRCDKCWEYRPGWVTGTRRYPYRGRYRRQQRSRSAPNSPRPASSSEIASYSDHELLAPSSPRTFPVKSLSDLAQFACNLRNITPKNEAQTTQSRKDKVVKPGEKVLKVECDSIGIKRISKKENSNDLCSPGNKSTFSDGTDILNPSDEDLLSLRMQEFEEGNKLKSKQYDSGISESFYSSQGSLADGFSLTQSTSTSMTNSQLDNFDSGLDSSCGLPKSEAVYRTKFSPLEPKTSTRSKAAEIAVVGATALPLPEFKTADCGREENLPALKGSKSVVIPSKPSTLPNITKSLTLPSTSAIATGMCVICLEQPKDASLVHGNSGHQVCCYQCGRTLKQNGKTCPVCRRPIQKVIRNFPG